MRSNSRRKRLMRQNSENAFGASCATFGASYATFGASCSNLFSTNWESHSQIGSEHLEDESERLLDFPDTGKIRNHALSRGVLRSNSRRQLTKRAQSEQSLGASFASFGTSCCSMLSTFVLEEDSLISELDQSLTGITDLSTKNCGPNPRTEAKWLKSTPDEACSVGKNIWCITCNVWGILQQHVINPMEIAQGKW